MAAMGWWLGLSKDDRLGAAAGKESSRPGLRGSEGAGWREESSVTRAYLDPAPKTAASPPPAYKLLLRADQPPL